MTYSTPLYGIPVPDGTSLAKNLPAELKAMGEGFEAALNAHVAIPVSNAAVVTATSAAARDSYWGTPTTETARLTLQARGATTIRTDKNITERFFATYDATSNPQGMTPAGWYPIGSPSSLIPTTRSAAERDAIFGTPSTSATQIELQNRGARTYRADLGVTEQYFAAYHATNNVSGRDIAGWYSTTRSSGLVPIRPTSITAVTGTASINALGKVTFSGCSAIALDGCYSTKFDNYIAIVRTDTTGPSTGYSLYYKLRANGVDDTAPNYCRNGVFIGSGAPQQIPATSTAQLELGVTAVGTFTEIKTSFPASARTTGIFSDQFAYTGGVNYAQLTRGHNQNNNIYDGFKLTIGGSGTISGTVEIYGWND